MDALETAMAMRAAGAMQALTGDLPSRRKQKAAFLQIARSMALQTKQGMVRQAFEVFSDHPNDLLQKAAVSAMSYASEPFETETVRGLMASYLETIAQLSALDAIKQYAMPIPAGSRHVTVGSGFTADATVEGAPKVVRKPSMTLGDVEPHKTIALIVLTKEFMLAGGDAALAVLDNEMSKAITAAINGAIYDHFNDSNVLSLPTAGDVLEDLRLAMRSAGPSQGYAAVVPPGICADLALRPEAGPNFTVSGGEFRPGLHVVTADNATGVMVIPASRCAVFDGGLELRPSGEASVEMSDSPTGNGELVSLWQSGSVGLLVERQWHVAGDAQVAIVEGS